MYIWIVYLHIVVIFIFLIQHAAEIWVSFKLREQKEPEGIFATYAFMHNNKIYELEFRGQYNTAITQNESQFDSIAQSFKFTK